MFSTPEGLTDNIPTSLRNSVPVKNYSARKRPCKFSEVLDVKQKTDLHRLGDDKSEHKDIITGHMLWSSIPERHIQKNNARINTDLYDRII